MNNDIIAGKWKEISGNLTKQWGKLTNDQVTQMKGSYKELSGALQKAYGYDEDAAKKQIDDYIKRNKYNEDDRE